jgi:predicted Rossmann fold nucleotide-binding protein DprA/Smf involved in DNA uptake
MVTTSNLELLHRLRDAIHRTSELELADLDRQIRALERVRPVSRTQRDGREHERTLLRAMQAAATPLPPREIAQRLGHPPKTVCRWLAAAKRRGFVERVDGARYRVREEVPPL